ncbi:MAG: hypothetical protein AAGD25_39835 [Cyanobacteria bacterium P01_F01_bin.150]
MSVAITKAITTLAEAEQHFQLSRTEADDFFLEWCDDLPELTDDETKALTELLRRYLYHRTQGQLLANTVTLLFASPLLTLAGFYDPPFLLKAERVDSDYIGRSR